MNVKYQVFVSSTYTDLIDERFAVIQCLLNNDCIPVGMEQFHGVPVSQWEYITKMLDNSDYCVLILAGKYGSIEEQSGISYTEKEFDYAVTNGIPVIRLLFKDLDSLAVKQSETDSTRREKLIAFREKIKRNSLVKFYDSIDDLKTKIATAINKAIKFCPRPGWIRRDSLDDNEHITKKDAEKLFQKQLEAHIASPEEIHAMLDKTFGGK